jgi:hypothetical protein
MTVANPVDFFDIRELLGDDERLIRDRVARVLDREVVSISAHCFAAERSRGSSSRARPSSACSARRCSHTQLIQARFANAVRQLTAAQLRAALEIARDCRDTLGAARVTLDHNRCAPYRTSRR